MILHFLFFNSLHFDNSLVTGLANIIASLIIAFSSYCLTKKYNDKKQKIEDDQIFKSLFESFNNRYNTNLNDLLNELKSNSGKSLEVKEKNLIIDYFNLCAEEYLWYKMGRIKHEVWDAWTAGIHENLKIPQVLELYKTETETVNQRKSFYGLYEELNVGDWIS
jgi:hypothetical protein